jgi:uncharacterized RDD family membrane protein YckC
MLVAGMVGVLVLMIGNLVIGMFTGSVGMLRDGGPIAIIFSLVCIGLAAFSFLIDFDAADQMIRAGAPEKAAWGIALGLTVTLVWLYPGDGRHDDRTTARPPVGKHHNCLRGQPVPPPAATRRHRPPAATHPRRPGLSTAARGLPTTAASGIRAAARLCPGAGPGVPQLPQEAYTPWVTRAVAWLIDYLPYLVLVGIGYGIEMATQETAWRPTPRVQPRRVRATGNSTLGLVAFNLCLLIGLGYLLWNYGYRQGTTGSSIGKSIMKFKVVSEKTGQPIGFGLSIVRQLAHVVDAIICYIGYLFPLWTPSDRPSRTRS